jgi:2-methylcitrate dehydratase PrpD
LHKTLTAVIDGMTENDLAFDDVAEVVVHVGKINLDRARPVPTGMVPKQRIDLLCNMTFAVAAAIYHRGLPLVLYRDGARADDVVRKAVPKVRFVEDPRQDGPWSLEPGLIDIKMRGGKVHHVERRIARGHPDNPMSPEERRAKFEDCVATAARPVAPARAREIMAMVDRLETIGDVRHLAAQLA